MTDDTKKVEEAEELAAAAEAGELVFGETLDADSVLPTPSAEASPDDYVLIPTTIRLTKSQRERLKVEGAKRGLDMSELGRQFIDEGLSELDTDYMVSVADLKRALPALRRLRRSA